MPEHVLHKDTFSPALQEGSSLDNTVNLGSCETLLSGSIFRQWALLMVSTGFEV